MAEVDDAPPRLLLVEGAEDEHVIRAIRERLPALPSFHHEAAGGVTQLLNRIDLEIDRPGREIVGFVLDGNDQPQDRWAAIRHRLRQANAPDPPSPDPAGTIIRRSDGADVGVWMMPDNGSPGELEDFLAAMIPNADRLWDSSKRFVESIPSRDRKFPEGKLLRAQIHVWLSVQERPRRSGQAIVAKDLDLAGGVAWRFQAWLSELFEPVRG